MAPVPVEPYDGMIIDATGQAFRPALINRIFTFKGEVLYDPREWRRRYSWRRDAANIRTASIRPGTPSSAGA